MMCLHLFRRKKGDGNRLDDDFIPVDETTQERIISKETAASWPTALQRVAAAHNAKSWGNPFMSNRSMESQTKMIICPELGKEILRLYEDCRQPVPCKNRNIESDSDTDDNSIDSHNDARKIHNHKHPPTSCSSFVRLHKPVKPNKLLQYALTNANGEAWRRQRPVVQRALGDSTVTKSVAVPASVTAALQLLTMENRQQNDPTSPMQTIEVRSFSLNVAASTMIAAVFGKSSVENPRRKQLQTAITNLFHPTLLPIRGDADKAAALDSLVHEMVENVASGCDSSDSNPCFALNLLHHQHDNAQPEPSSSSLSRQEVIGNCHSALLAGTQTIATTLAGSMLHLAEYKHEMNTMSSSSQKSWFRAVVHETLRILPPVASLPRCPVNSDLEIPTADNNALKSEGSNTTAIPKGSELLMDVLSMAHCPLLHTNESTDRPGEVNTWKFCLVLSQDSCYQSKNNSTTRMQPPSYPWGFGDRKCPAGNLSVSCISAVLETLVVQKGLTWQLTNPDQDGVGELGTGGWVATVSYRPTLTYPNSLFLSLSPPCGVHRGY